MGQKVKVLYKSNKSLESLVKTFDDMVEPEVVTFHLDPLDSNQLFVFLIQLSINL